MLRAAPGVDGPAAAEDAAATWYGRRSSGDWGPGDEAAFQAWLAAESSHRAAYVRVETVMAGLSILEGDPALDALRAEARAQARNTRGIRRAAPLAGIAAVAAVLAAAVFAGSTGLGVERKMLQTGPGEVRRTVLSDGTQAWLGPETQVEVAYARHQRALTVRHGEAFFDVVKNRQRPFVVAARDRRVIAVGTAFDVRAFGPDLVVTLVRGAVDIRRSPTVGAAEAHLSPGQQYWLRGDVGGVRHVDAEAQVAWRQGLVVLDDVSLDEAVAAFNHNSKVKLQVGDARLSSLRVSGTFRADRADDFARALEVEAPLVAQRQTSGDIILKRREAT